MKQPLNLKGLVGKNFKKLKEIETFILEKTGLHATCFFSESEQIKGSDLMIDYELYEKIADKKNKHTGGYDGEVHTMFYKLNADNSIHITEI